MIIGKHLVAGQWLAGPSEYEYHALDAPISFPNGSQEIVNQAAEAAKKAFRSYAKTDAATRATFLRTIAQEIDKRGDDITEICHQESGLPHARLIGERARTTGQLNMFADHIEQGKHLDRHIDHALPDRAPLPRPDLRRIMRPFGPVVVFGASNFPLAFSTAGGDTASALAAGCPVIVKAHSAHSATADIVAQAILAAIESCELDPGVFALLHDSGRQTAQQLVTHPVITAVGFTGSLGGGRALYDLCCQRPNPIPFYGEMGSLNPVFVLPHKLDEDGDSIATGWSASLTMGAGQFCTKPSLLIVPPHHNTDALIESITSELEQKDAQVMLTDSIANSFHQGVEDVKNSGKADIICHKPSDNRSAYPNVFVTSVQNWMQSKELQEEVFGPFAIILKAQEISEMEQFAESLNGQLTATLLFNQQDHQQAKALLDILEHKAGRVLANGYPTGVEVCDAMVHGGPYPASTFMNTTSVGSHAIQRFLRPVCYQNIPQELLPLELQ